MKSVYKQNPITVEYLKLPIDEQNFLREGFAEHLVESGKCSSINGAEDDYQHRVGEYYIYKNQFYFWVASYLKAKENSLERLLERSKAILADEFTDTTEIPMGVTVDRFGFCYCLRTQDDIGLRTFSLSELKQHWNAGLKLKGNN